MLCAGNLSEYCGGPNRLDVYNYENAIATITASATASPTATPTGPAIKPTVGPYTYYGCQTEATDARALPSNSTASDAMTLEYCASFCSGSTAPYAYFGAEYGRECECLVHFDRRSQYLFWYRLLWERSLSWVECHEQQ